MGETEFLLDSYQSEHVYVCVFTLPLRNCIITASLDQEGLISTSSVTYV